MKQQVFKYLKSYSTTPLEVDRLIVSAFLKTNHIKVVKNSFIKSLIITSDNIDESEKLKDFILVIKSEIPKFDLEALIELFEFVISPSDRIINGAIYTPKYIREYITNRAFYALKSNYNHIKIADISCGCGGFLLTASKKLKKVTKLPYKSIFAKNIFGLDIQNYSTTRTKILLSVLAISEKEDAEFSFNLFTDDALTFDWKNQSKDFSGFDMILGNPPYVCAKNMTKETINKIQKFKVSNSGNADLYIPFFQLGIENLNQNGVLGLITMNSFYKSLNGRNLREYFKTKSLGFKIIDFGTEQVFKSKNTYTCICIIENKTKNYIKYCKRESKLLPKKEKEFSKIPYSGLNSKSGWNLNDFETISKIEATGIPFGNLFKTRHGIATLKNDIFIFNPIREDDDYYYLQNGSLFQIEKGICRDIINANKLSRTVGLDNLKEKVIFPYDNETKPNLLDEDFVIKMYPRAYQYLKKKKKILAGRDKGKGNYEKWFAFGRTQSLEKIENKLFFPKMSDRIPSFLMESDENLLFYNGQAVIGHTNEEMVLARKIMESKLFWYYVKTTSKPYTSEYYSFNGNYIKNFGVCDLNKSELDFVINENSKVELDKFFEKKYDITITE
ncbi:HsdM family class I SAM-dependent methyltransferase [Gelidibacter salicanalis]|uniref:site-specific DNA-methyltransferase (adenine-specific) n=1 Tax=Gelidibacter salicanalis TaxID=291193 RepID=A0A934NE36_9FLAO|nr:N-6 DNA methylase [Gelidibacter salicanalis]MBJ7882300.1 N-6 DNA methylase [Gelidibacter salicanalis]